MSDKSGGPSTVTDTPLPLGLPLPLTKVDVGVPDCAFPDAISGDCWGSSTMFGVQSEELCMMLRCDGRLVLRESEGRISGMFGVDGGVENVSLSGECIVGPRCVGVRLI